MRWWNDTTQSFFASCFMANKPTAHLVPRHLCPLASATIRLMTSSHLRPTIWSTTSGRNRMIMMQGGAWIEEASRLRKQASKSNKESLKGGLSNCTDARKWSKTVLLVCLPIINKELLLTRMWLGYASTITLWILPLWAVWPIDSIQPAT